MALSLRQCPNSSCCAPTSVVVTADGFPYDSGCVFTWEIFEPGATTPSVTLTSTLPLFRLPFSNPGKHVVKVTCDCSGANSG